jgi:1,4-dihydroxy-2-naphthoyl-CoA hydrolase
MIWKQEFNLESVNAFNKNTLVDHLGIEFTNYGEDYIEASMPVDHRTVQPMRLLHGGASAALAETLGSVASYLCLDDPDNYTSVGVEINANHLRSVTEGKVIGRVTPLKIGKTMQVWQIKIRDNKSKLICVSRLTIAIVKRR